jgi:hypothetical protein
VTTTFAVRAILVALALAGCAAGPSAPPAKPPASAVPSRAVFSGCLLATNEAEAAHHPPPPVTRSQGPAARITAMPGGVTVEHPLTHACCLTGAVTTRLEGRTAVVSEKLAGTACRCRCGSTIRTEVTLAPGAWTVIVELDDGSGPQRVAQLDVSVR